MREAQLDLDDLSTATGISRDNLGRYRRGERTPRVENEIALAKTFGATQTDWLMEAISP